MNHLNITELIGLSPTLCNINTWHPREMKFLKENNEVIHWQNFVLRYNSSIRHAVNNAWIQYMNHFYMNHVDVYDDAKWRKLSCGYCRWTGALDVHWEERTVSVDMKCMVAKANVLLVRGGSCRNGVGNSISLVPSPRPTFISCRVGSPYGVWASLWRHVQIRTLCKLLRHTLQLLVQISPLKKKISNQTRNIFYKSCFLATSHRNSTACPALRTICKC